MTEKQTEALEKLNRGIKESRQEVQQRTMSLAQDYFDDSVAALKQQINESRATLEDLPDQVPGGREEVFQTMFQELMDNYSAIEECINEARQNVANLDTDQIRRQGEIEASDAARREARELGVDLTQIEGTGSEGRIIIDDVRNAAEAADNGAAQQAQDAAGQAADQTQQAAGQATDQAGQVAGQVTDQAGQVAGQVQDAVGQATGQVGQIADQAGGPSEEIDATDAAKREAEERGIDLSKIQGTGADGRIVIWDVTEYAPEAEGGTDPAGQLQNQASAVAGQAVQGAGDVASQATGQAGQAASQVGDTATQVAGQADGAVEQASGAANQLTEQAIGTAQQTADQAGQTAQGAESVADQAGQGNVAQGSAEEPKITKAAQRKAEEMGVDISQIQGTGAGGLITIKDVVDS